jgi:hypothetical protein
MPMIRHDLACWPAVVTVARGAMTLEEQIGFLGDWNRWLDRGEPFATLRLFADEQSLVHPEGGAREARNWLQANAARLRAQVRGMATIVPASHLERISRMDAERLFGVPARSFGEVEAALDWMDETLRKPLAFDRARVRAALTALAAETG